jgi:NitT/TauT family transport system substrate-binding protein
VSSLVPSRGRALQAFASAAAAFAAVGSRASAQTRPAIRVAALPSEAAASCFYAQEQGFFASNGIDVQIQTMTNGGAIASALASGAVDIGNTTPVTLAIAKQRGIPFLAVAPGALYTTAAPFSALYVAKESPIRGARDLVGKVIAVNGLSTLTEYGPRAWLDKNQVDNTAVKFVEMPFPAMVEALIAGRIDAAQIGEPDLAVANAKNRLLALTMSAIAPQFLFGVWFAASAWTKAHPDLAAKFASALHATAVWANAPANQTRSGAILAQFTKIPAPVIATMTRARYGETLDPGLVQPVIDIAARYAHFPVFPAREILYSASR